MSNVPRDNKSHSRRDFLSVATAAVAATAAPPSLSISAQEAPVLLPAYIADVTGDGLLGPDDASVVDLGLFSQRGFNLTAAPGFDHRADIFGRGAIDPIALESVIHSIDVWRASATQVKRPITIAWHYGWYNTLNRPPGLQTVRLKGGDYLSFDPAVETIFHDLKNEFGVTVDALSWIPKRDNKDNQDNYRNAFLRAPNVDTRHICLLYESTISLPFVGSRINFRSPVVQKLLRQDFVEMAQFFKEIRDDTPGRIFSLDGRPVLFIFGTHTWGVTPVSRGDFDTVDAMISDVRNIFADIYGSPPYIVGEEMFLSTTGEFSPDRRRRTQNFDAIYVYHHASNLKPLRPGIEARLPMSPLYIENQVRILRRTYRAVADLRCRFTRQPILVIPNLAPGFAKPGNPTLLLGRSGYADFLKLMTAVHEREHIETSWRSALGTSLLPASIYIVGSWNEEFEGHCVFPFDFNFSVPEVVQQGFDLAMPVKEVFGWNHYAQREIG